MKSVKLANWLLISLIVLVLFLVITSFIGKDRIEEDTDGTVLKKNPLRLFKSGIRRAPVSAAEAEKLITEARAN